MKSFALWGAILALGFTLATGDAEAAKRLGGGKSSGMQRESTTQHNAASPAPTPAPNQAAAASAAKSPAPAAAPQAQPKRSWMGPLAGLAAGLGLAALASHFGFGQELASMLLIGLAVMAVLAVVGFLMRKKAAAAAGPAGLQYAGAGAPLGGAQPAFEPLPAGSAAAPAGAAPARIPADFDVDGFVRNAKVNFLRLQAANDAGNLDDLRQFTTPEMFGEIKLAIVERGATPQETDVVRVDAQIIEVVEEGKQYVASVRFDGLIRESREAAAEAFSEVWHLVKPRDGSGGWVIAGIQQLQ